MPADAARCACHAAARSGGSAFCPRCCTRTAKPGKSPFGLEAAVLACGSRREAEATRRAGRCSARCKIRVRRGSVHVVRTDTQGWPRGLAAARAGARCPQRGRHGRAGMPVPLRGAPPSSSAAGADTCARVHLERDPREDGLGDLPSPTPPGFGARHLAARGAQGVPPSILDKGSGCGSTALPLTCGAAGDARSPPPTRGRQRG